MRSVKVYLAGVADRYSNDPSARALMQLVPYLGGPIDTLISGRASQIQMQRFGDFLEQLKEEVEAIKVDAPLAAPDEEALLDLFRRTAEGSMKTRSKEKRGQFARILAKQGIRGHGWDEAETVARLVEQLDTVHIRVLIAAMEVSTGLAPFENLHVIALREN